MQKELGAIFLTDDLSVFKTLKGNREVKDARKQTLVESIDKNGYIANPIIVNEKYEVIDGQGRLAACKELGSPIAYTIVPGIGIKECMVLNMNMKNWSMLDYIQSYAKQGNANYKRILKLAGMGVGFRTYMFANGIYGGTGPVESVMRAGKAICTEDSFQNAKNALEYLMEVKPFTDNVNGRRTDLESAVLFAYEDECCDNARLKECLSKSYNIIGNIISIATAMDEISSIYNRNLKGKTRLYLREDYDRYKH